MDGLKIVGLGGSLRAQSRSRAALETALEGAAMEGAAVELLDLRRLNLPMFSPQHEADPPQAVQLLVDTCHGADGMLWSSPMYNGTVSGSFKNAIDWLHVLGTRDPPFLHDTVVGLISAAGGTQGLQVVNTMEYATRALRAWAVPYVVPIAGATTAFSDTGTVEDETVVLQLRTLGAEVARVATRFAQDPALHRQRECDDASERVASAAVAGA